MKKTSVARHNKNFISWTRLLDNYRLFLTDIHNRLASLDEIEEFLLRNW